MFGKPNALNRNNASALPPNKQRRSTRSSSPRPQTDNVKPPQKSTTRTSAVSKIISPPNETQISTPLPFPTTTIQSKIFPLSQTPDTRQTGNYMPILSPEAHLGYTPSTLCWLADNSIAFASSHIVVLLSPDTSAQRLLSGHSGSIVDISYSQRSSILASIQSATLIPEETLTHSKRQYLLPSHPNGLSFPKTSLKQSISDCDEAEIAESIYIPPNSSKEREATTAYPDPVLYEPTEGENKGRRFHLLPSLLCLWDTTSSSLLQSVSCHPLCVVFSLSISDDGESLVIAGKDKTGKTQLLFYSLSDLHSTGEVRLVTKQHTQFDVHKLKFCPGSSDRFISLGRGSVRLWRLKTGTLRSVNVNMKEFSSLSFTDCVFLLPDLFSPTSGSLTVPHQNVQNFISQHPSSHLRFFVSGSNGSLFLCDTDEHIVECAFHLQEDPIQAVALLPAFCSTGSSKGLLTIASLDLSEVYAELDLHSSIVSLCPSSSGQIVAAATENGMIGVFDVISQKFKHLYRSHPSFVPRSRLMPVRSITIPPITRRATTISSLAIRPNSTEFATAASDGTIRVWDISLCVYGTDSSTSARQLAMGGSPQIVEIGTSHDTPVAITFSPLVRWDATHLDIHGQKSLQMRPNFDYSHPSSNQTSPLPAFYSSSAILLVGFASGRLSLFNTATQQPMGDLLLSPQLVSISALAFDKQGQLLFCGLASGNLVVFDTNEDTRKRIQDEKGVVDGIQRTELFNHQLRVIEGGANRFHSVIAVSKDNSRLASISVDPTRVFIVSIPSLQHTKTLSLPTPLVTSQERITSLAFTNDPSNSLIVGSNERIVTFSEDGTVIGCVKQSCSALAVHPSNTFCSLGVVDAISVKVTGKAILDQRMSQDMDQDPAVTEYERSRESAEMFNFQARNGKGSISRNGGSAVNVKSSFDSQASDRTSHTSSSSVSAFSIDSVNTVNSSQPVQIANLLVPQTHVQITPLSSLSSKFTSTSPSSAILEPFSQSFSGHYGIITNTAFSSDGSKLITTSSSGSVMVWSVKKEGSGGQPDNDRMGLPEKLDEHLETIDRSMEKTFANRLELANRQFGIETDENDLESVTDREQQSVSEKQESRREEYSKNEDEGIEDEPPVERSEEKDSSESESDHPQEVPDGVLKSAASTPPASPRPLPRIQQQQQQQQSQPEPKPQHPMDARQAIENLQAVEAELNNWMEEDELLKQVNQHPKKKKKKVSKEKKVKITQPQKAQTDSQRPLSARRPLSSRRTPSPGIPSVKPKLTKRSHSKPRKKVSHTPTDSEQTNPANEAVRINELPLQHGQIEKDSDETPHTTERGFGLTTPVAFSNQPNSLESHETENIPPETDEHFTQTQTDESGALFTVPNESEQFSQIDWASADRTSARQMDTLPRNPASIQPNVPSIDAESAKLELVRSFSIRDTEGSSACPVTWIGHNRCAFAGVDGCVPVVFDDSSRDIVQPDRTLDDIRQYHRKYTAKLMIDESLVTPFSPTPLTNNEAVFNPSVLRSLDCFPKPQQGVNPVSFQWNSEDLACSTLIVSGSEPVQLGKEKKAPLSFWLFTPRPPTWLDEQERSILTLVKTIHHHKSAINHAVLSSTFTSLPFDLFNNIITKMAIFFAGVTDTKVAHYPSLFAMSISDETEMKLSLWRVPLESMISLAPESDETVSLVTECDLSTIPTAVVFHPNTAFSFATGTTQGTVDFWTIVQTVDCDGVFQTLTKLSPLQLALRSHRRVFSKPQRRVEGKIGAPLGLDLSREEEILFGQLQDVIDTKTLLQAIMNHTTYKLTNQRGMSSSDCLAGAGKVTTICYHPSSTPDSPIVFSGLENGDVAIWNGRIGILEQLITRVGQSPIINLEFLSATTSFHTLDDPELPPNPERAGKSESRVMISEESGRITEWNDRQTVVSSHMNEIGTRSFESKQIHQLKLIANTVCPFGLKRVSSISTSSHFFAVTSSNCLYSFSLERKIQQKAEHGRETQKKIVQLEPHTNVISHSVSSFDSNGTFIATANHSDNTVRIWMVGDVLSNTKQPAASDDLLMIGSDPVGFRGGLEYDVTAVMMNGDAIRTTKEENEREIRARLSAMEVAQREEAAGEIPLHVVSEFTWTDFEEYSPDAHLTCIALQRDFTMHVPANATANSKHCLLSKLPSILGTSPTTRHCLLVVGTNVGEIGIFDTMQGCLVWHAQPFSRSDPVVSVAFTHFDEVIMASSKSGLIALLDLKKGACALHPIRPPAEEKPKRAKLSRRSKPVEEEPPICILRPVHPPLIVHATINEAIDFTQQSPLSDRLFLTFSKKWNALCVWCVYRQSIAEKGFVPEREWVEESDLAPNGKGKQPEKTFAMNSSDLICALVRKRKFSDEEMNWIRSKHSQPLEYSRIQSVAFNPTDRRRVTLMTSHSFFSYSFHRNELDIAFPALAATPYSMASFAHSPHFGDCFVVGRQDGVIALQEVRQRTNDQDVQLFRSGNGPVERISVCLNGYFLLTHCPQSGILLLWKVK
ncbi:hypothetical protein BLNAU_5618 [Blattamonas nauphoetae]|uniref:Uncharacterized protein n=1 Tax=Blattamonas nauphoetae TaxID=2049346 RepID=A0ABQ9Y6I5_9EUKA|nr:hypothetical protein BLNAU_5618 [Blattamonas nauphoetae]